MLFPFLLELILSDVGMIKEDSNIVVVLPVLTANIMVEVSLILLLLLYSSQFHMCFPLIAY